MATASVRIWGAEGIEFREDVTVRISRADRRAAAGTSLAARLSSRPFYTRSAAWPVAGLPRSS